MKIVYFASLRQKMGVGEECLDPPATIDRVDSLIAWIKERSPAHRAALDSCPRLMVAVNQSYAAMDTAIAPADEVAFFPPVTGG